MKTIENRIAAGIVTFNPDINRLWENICAIIEQVDRVFIFDNGSANVSDILEICNPDNRIALICSDTNRGIAFALNRLFENALSEGFDWLLTLDQDSVCFQDLVRQYKQNFHTADSLSCYFVDKTVHGGSAEYFITSGNMVKISAWETIHGFNENLFIDMVDVDFCFRLTQNNFKIRRIPYCGFQHQMGDGSTWKILGRNIFIGNYSAFRKYYIFRNMVYVIRKYHLRFHHYSYIRLGLLFCHTILFEPEKHKKIQSMLKGFRDGFRQYKWIDSYWDQFKPALGTQAHNAYK